MFDIDPSTGQIRTKTGVTYNYEAISGRLPPATRLLTQQGSAATGATRWRWRSGTASTLTGSRWRKPTADDSITVKIASA